VTGDPINGAEILSQAYVAADPHYTGRVTVPVLWDKARRTIVSNESAEIIRMFNSAFDGIEAASGDYYPEPLRAQIDALNERMYRDVNNGVYRAGFATTQAAYEEAVVTLFKTLDWLEARLSGSRFLIGDWLTEADIRLFTTLVRFDAVYHGHFKCNLRRIADYPALWRFTRDIYNLRKIAETVNLDHIRRHYYESHTTINPTVWYRSDQSSTSQYQHPPENHNRSLSTCNAGRPSWRQRPSTVVASADGVIPFDQFELCRHPSVLGGGVRDRGGRSLTVRNEPLRSRFGFFPIGPWIA
jgi:glutathionyl-hydroquinone reductase